MCAEDTSSPVVGMKTDAYILPRTNKGGSLQPHARQPMVSSNTESHLRGMKRLVEATKSLSMARDLRGVMDVVRHAARGVVGADGATFVLREGSLCFYADEDAIAPLWKGLRFPMNFCVSGWSMLNRRAVAIQDIYQDPRIPADAYRPTFVKSLAMVPIRINDPIGAIGTYWAEKRQPTAAELEILQALADLTSVALENVRHLEELRKKAEDEEFLGEAAMVLSESLDRRRTLLNLGRLIVPKLADWYAVDLAPGGIDELVVRHVDRTKEDRTRRFQTLLGADDEARDVLYILSRPEVDAPGEMIEQARLSVDQLRLARPLGIKSLAIVRILTSSRTTGLLTLGTTEESGRLLGRRELTLAKDLARHCAVAIEKAGLFQSIQEAVRLRDEFHHANQSKDVFLAMLGHELRNPLAAIRSASEVIRLSRVDDQRLRKAQAVLDRQTSRMTRLMDGLLDVTRIARGKISLQPRVLDVGVVLREIAEDRIPDARAHGLELTTHIPDEPVWVSADHVRLVQVFDNLVGNAIKFTESPGSINMTLHRDDIRAVIRIRDTGIGIRPEMIPRLFEPFHQEPQNIARTAGGVGLGLALVAGLVELHGGTVDARSDGQGKGSEFEVRLPLVPPPSDRTREIGHAFESTPRRIMIVEDNLDVAVMLQQLLELQGHVVALAEDGGRGLEILRTEDFDVLLCDIGLPGMSGYDVAREIRSDASLNGVVLVALTGYGQPEDRERTFEAGFDGHLTKPVDLKALDEILRRHTGPDSTTTQRQTPGI